MTRHFNIADMFELVADKVPDRIALVCGVQRSTFLQLEERANRLAHFLASRDVKAGDHVGLYLYNCNEYLESMLACFKLRAVPINVNYRYVEEELSYIFENSNMSACIHNREFVPHIASIQSAVPKLHTCIYVEDSTQSDPNLIAAVEYEFALAEQSAERDFSERSDDDLFILYTGGTTGFPKGVMWPHKSVFFAALGGGGLIHPDGAITSPEQITSRVSKSAMRCMALAPLMHGSCWWFACIQLLAGNTVVLNPEHSLVGDSVWDIVEREKVNSIAIVGDAMAAPLLESLENHPERWDLSTVYGIGSGGAVFSESKQEAFRQRLPKVVIRNSFGSSESGNMGTDGGGTKGKGLGNVTKSDFMSVISDIEGEAHLHVAPGEMGIFARSGYIPTGYYNDPVKTAKTFVEIEGETWLLVGDEACLEKDSSITIFGRGSNCINSGGEKIFPEEVEQALKNHPGIYDCLVVATPDQRFGSKVTAIVAVKGDALLSLSAVQDDARKHIAGYKVPRELHVVTEVPRAPSGKPAYPKALEIALSGRYRVS
jgi:acyl-CoA synthetase (AMP-forming)/AMP-acid ligase II